ncbi:MAG: hypothetical protein IT334_07115 [Thermomicrobiales bacterium]|nr:hypothetical protein [Thermomicrobiales bacterium]
MRIIGIDEKDDWDARITEGFPPRDQNPDGPGIEGTLGAEELLERDRLLLAPAQKAMERAGFYAYSTINQEGRLAVASDDETGRFDIWVDDNEFVVTLWASNPGLYMDEENAWRRRSMERLARLAIPRVAKGMLEEHQEAMWDDDDHGVAVRLTYYVPLSHVDHIGELVRHRIPELAELITYVERQLI